MYSPSLEILLKSIKQGTENPSPLKKQMDVPSGLPFKLFPTLNKQNIVNKKIVIIGNSRTVEILLSKMSKVNGLTLYYCGDLMCINSVKKIEKDNLNSVSDVDIFMIFGIENMKQINGGKIYLVLEKGHGLQLNMINSVNRDVDRVYVFSDFYKNDLIKNGIEKPIHVIKLGVDELRKDISKERSDLALTDNNFVIVCPKSNRIDIALMAFAEFICMYPDLPCVLICCQTQKFALDIFKYELIQKGLPVHLHIHKLYFIEKAELAYGVADVGLHTDDDDNVRFDFLEFISFGKQQIVPNYGFYSQYALPNNDIVVEINTKMYNVCEMGLGLTYNVEPKMLCAGLKQAFDNRDKKPVERNWGSWFDDFIKSLN